MEKGYRLDEFCPSSKPIEAYSYLGQKEDTSGSGGWARALTALLHPGGLVPATLTYRICAAPGSCSGPVGLFLTPDGIPDEEREGTSQFLI